MELHLRYCIIGQKLHSYLDIAVVEKSCFSKTPGILFFYFAILHYCLVLLNQIVL